MANLILRKEFSSGRIVLFRFWNEEVKVFTKIKDKNPIAFFKYEKSYLIM
jgi:hypothetical protein